MRPGSTILPRVRKSAHRGWSHSRLGPTIKALNHDVQGGIAQLVERIHGMDEVRGSSPLASTYVERTTACKGRFSLLGRVCM